MARRATSPSRKPTGAQTGSSATLSEAAGTEAPRRGRKAKSAIAESVEPSLADALFPGGDEPTEKGAELGSGQPAKVRRGRKPKAQPDEQAPAPMVVGDGVAAESAPPEPTPDSDEEPASDVQVDHSASPSEAPRKAQRRRTAQAEGQPKAGMDPAPAEQPTQQAAARWNAETGTAAFDWPSIEQVAATGGPNQAMAKLLLAARAEGANSRWPF